MGFLSSLARRLVLIPSRTGSLVLDRVLGQILPTLGELRLLAVGLKVWGFIHSKEGRGGKKGLRVVS
jgi:hypothetical protein